MKKVLAAIAIVLSTSLPAFAHKLRDPSHMNPHWLPAAICIGALAIFAIAFFASEFLSKKMRRKQNRIR